MAGLVDPCKREVTVLAYLPADVRGVDADVLVAGGAEGIAVRVCDVQGDLLSAHVVTDEVAVAVEEGDTDVALQEVGDGFGLAAADKVAGLVAVRRGQ